MSGFLGDAIVTILLGGLAGFVTIFFPLIVLFSHLDDFPPGFTYKEWFIMVVTELVAVSILFGLYWYWQYIFTEILTGV